MSYFKVNDVDLSIYVSGLTITKTAKYNSQTNAKGNSVVDYINTKRTIEVEIIPLLQSQMQTVLAAVAFSSVVDYQEPSTGAMVTGVQCVCDEQNIDYYTIQSNKVMYQKMKLTFQEL